MSNLNPTTEISNNLQKYFPDPEILENVKNTFFSQWLPKQSLIIDFNLLGITTLPIELSDCEIEYELITGGQLLVLTTYRDEEAIEKDRNFIDLALNHKAMVVKGLQTVALFDTGTAEFVINSILKAREEKS